MLSSPHPAAGTTCARQAACSRPARPRRPARASRSPSAARHLQHRSALLSRAHAPGVAWNTLGKRLWKARTRRARGSSYCYVTGSEGTQHAHTRRRSAGEAPPRSQPLCPRARLAACRTRPAGRRCPGRRRAGAPPWTAAPAASCVRGGHPEHCTKHSKIPETLPSTEYSQYCS